MLDFYGSVKSDVGKFAMQLPRNGHRVTGPIEEVGITKSDMLYASLLHLVANILQNNLARNDKEAPTIHGSNWTVATGVQTSSARFYVSGRHYLPISHEMGIPLTGGQHLANRLSKG